MSSEEACRNVALCESTKLGQGDTGAKNHRQMSSSDSDCDEDVTRQQAHCFPAPRNRKFSCFGFLIITEMRFFFLII